LCYPAASVVLLICG